MHPATSLIEAFTYLPRYTAIQQCEDTIQHVGWIEDFHLFGDSSMNFVISLPAQRIEQLLAELRETHTINLCRFDPPQVDDPQREALVYMYLSFLGQK